MKTSTAPSTTSHSTSVARSGSFFGRSRSSRFFGSVMRSATPMASSSEPTVQAKLSVSKPDDPMEVEADRAADRVMRMRDVQMQRTAEDRATPEVQRQAEAPDVQRQAEAEAPEVQRRADADGDVQRKAEVRPTDDVVQRMGVDAPAVAPDAQTELQQATTGGRALPSEVREHMEPRFGADLGDVRIHTDEQAASLSNHMSARAFTYRNHVFFGRDQFQPGTDSGRHLLAHELSHTIQQGATVQRRADRPPAAPEEAQRTPELTPSRAAPTVQRLGVQDALDYFADKAHNIMGFRMLTLILGFNPINRRSVARTPANFLRALIELVPGGNFITRALDNHGVINEAAAWVDQKVRQLGDIGSQIVGALRRFIDSLSWTDIFDLGDVWARAKRIFTEPIGNLISFGTAVVGELLGIVKRVILRPLAALAEGTRGYDLLKAILGEDPITGEPHPRTPDNLIGGFMRLIGQEEVWLDIQRGNAVARAMAWFNGALAGLRSIVASIPGRIVTTIRSLTFQDVVTVVGAFNKIAGAFLGLAGTFVSWAGRQVLSLLEILFSVVAPGVMPYIAKARAAFTSILRNPVGFVGNLVRAGRLGFQGFARRIGTHLKSALIKWLVGPLAEAGVYIPKSFSLLEIIRLVLSVLGLTWANLRTKLLKIIPESVLSGLEKTASVLVTLATQGPAAAWDQIKEELTELKSQLIGQVTQMVTVEIVKAAVSKLVTMINPAGAVVQAVIAIYNTITFFVEKARQIGAVVASFVNSIAAIAAGRVGAAAARVEQTLANSLVVVIGFLAKFAGLGSIPTKLVKIVEKIRKPVDRALDKIVGWLGKLLGKLLAKAKAGIKALLQWWKKQRPIGGGDEPHTLTFSGERTSAKLVVRSQPERPSTFLTREHTKRKQSPDELTEPLAATQGHEQTIENHRTKLAGYDDNELAAASGDQRKQANAESSALDQVMTALAGVIGRALAAWGGEGKMPRDVVIDRAGGFTVRQKQAIADEYLEQKRRLAGTRFAQSNLLVSDSRGRRISVAANIDRRHVVSSNDMATHYGEVLADKPLSEAKLMVEQRGSIGQAREPVQGERPTVASVIAAAKRRYRRFFGYAKNVFLGDSSENRSIQEHLDAGHPEMAGQKLRDHVERVKRGWALDGSFQETPVKSS
jgi:hypothetical protein